MKRGDKVAVVCCSNGLNAGEQEKIEQLEKTLSGFGLIPVLSRYLYAGESVFSGTGKERAETLMEYFRSGEIKTIFDISGGDIANEILPFLDFEDIKNSEALFCGYSDLTTVMNAIYAKTGKSSVWYQAKNLVGREAKQQCIDFEQAFLNGHLREPDNLFSVACEFLQGIFMEGILVGGNIRCLLKLAGTPYWPSMAGKILFLEARSGSLPQMTAYLNQLKQMGVFEQINGILLGTFLQMEKEEMPQTMGRLVRQYVGTKLPVAQTMDVGHRSNSKSLWIGENYQFQQ